MTSRFFQECLNCNFTACTDPRNCYKDNKMTDPCLEERASYEAEIARLKKVCGGITFDAYQIQAKEFAEYHSPIYPFLALAEEVGEFLTIPAKEARGDDVETKYGGVEGIQERVIKEAGDVLWQLTACLEEYGLTLSEVAETNIKKLTDRQKRGVIKGDGDFR